MIYLVFPMMFLNLHLGFIIFRTYFRTKQKNEHANIFLKFLSLNTAVILMSSRYAHIIFLVYTPLLIGFFVFLKHLLLNRNSEEKKLDLIIIVCEMTLIYLKTGRSFDESLRLSLSKNNCGNFIFLEKKKNVVMQQPKSSKSQLFTLFEQDLAQIRTADVGKYELLLSIKAKYDSLSSLKQKLKTATTQYRAQSFTLLVLWCASFLSLLHQGKGFQHKEIIICSLIMMCAGLALSKKTLIKTEFQI